MNHTPGAKQAAGAAMVSNGKRPPLEQRLTNGPSKMTTRLVGGQNALRPAAKRMPPFATSAPARRLSESSAPGFTKLDHDRQIAIPSDHLYPCLRPAPTEDMMITPADFDPTSRPLDECYFKRSEQRAQKAEQRKALEALPGEPAPEDVSSPGSPVRLMSALRLNKDLLTGSIAYKGTPEEFLEEVKDGNIHRSDLVKRTRDDGWFKPDWDKQVYARGVNNRTEPANALEPSRPATARRPYQNGGRRAYFVPAPTRIVPGPVRPARRNLLEDEELEETPEPLPIVPPREYVPIPREPVIRRPVPARVLREPVIRKPPPEKPLPPSPEADSPRRQTVYLPARPVTSAGELSSPPRAPTCSRFSLASEGSSSAESSPRMDSMRSRM